MVEPNTPANTAQARYLLAERAKEEIRWKLKESPEFAESGSLQRALLDLEVLCECLKPEVAPRATKTRRKS